MEKIKNRLANLLSVKSIVTILLSVVFSYLSIVKEINGEQFLMIFATIIAFYYGTQSQKTQDVLDKDGGNDG